MEPMQLEEGTLNIQEFNSMELLQDAQKMKKMREELWDDVKMLKADIMVELKEEFKVELKQEIVEELKVEMKEAVSKEFGKEKELLRKMKICFLSNDNDIDNQDEESDSQSQESVNLLKEYRYS